MPTMNISLTAEIAAFVDREMRSGRYASASELVRESLRMLERERALEDEELALTRAAVAEGLADMAAGRFSERSVGDIAQDVLGRHARRAG